MNFILVSKLACTHIGHYLLVRLMGLIWVEVESPCFPLCRSLLYGPQKSNRMFTRKSYLLLSRMIRNSAHSDLYCLHQEHNISSCPTYYSTYLQSLLPELATLSILNVINFLTGRHNFMIDPIFLLPSSIAIHHIRLVSLSNGFWVNRG